MNQSRNIQLSGMRQHSLSVQLSQGVHFVQSLGANRPLCETMQTLYNWRMINQKASNGHSRPSETGTGFNESRWMLATAHTILTLPHVASVLLQDLIYS